jgi:hypothetical protein
LDVICGLFIKNLPYADPEAMVGGGVSTGATNGTNSVRGYGYSVGSLPANQRYRI